MTHPRIKNIGLALACVTLVASCGAFQNGEVNPEDQTVKAGRESKGKARAGGGSILDALKGRSAADVKVNRFLWTATLDVLSFLPIEAADPFTGVISTGYGRPPGGGKAYRATVLISDPALDARSLNVALQTNGGRSVDAGTQRAVEDAILARARQLRISSSKF